MDLALLSHDGLMFLIRMLHVFFGIIWIGHLYYLNFVQGAFMNEIDAPTKTIAQSKLFPKVFWWFRYGALGTALMGLIYLGIIGHQRSVDWHSSYGAAILTGSLLGLIMASNVWFRIWPIQKKIIASAQQVASGGKPIDGLAALAPKAALASRTNVLFSIPMLFFMLSARHLPIEIMPETSLTNYTLFVLILTGALTLNGIKGKMGPMTTVRGVIHMGFLLAVVYYLGLELLT